jgi:SOS response regulatory protein OraA/RecX
MTESIVFFYFFLVFLFLFLGTALKAFSLKKENKLLAEQLTDTTVSLERTRQNLSKLQEKHEIIAEFQNSLGEAEEKAKFQRPRYSELQSPERPRNTPERYSYIHSLAEKGLSFEEIASILTISTHEARQLLVLSKIAKGN